MATFRPGLELAQAFYTDIVRPLVAVPHTACLLGEGSEVLGYDTPRSTDHEWGPRVQLFVAPEQVGPIRDTVTRGLPDEYDGWPTAWYSLAHDAIAHHVEVTTFDEWITGQLGSDPRHKLDHAFWLGLSQQRLLQVTRGAVFHDDAGELTRVRALLAWYPTDVWRWLLASQWRLIGNTEPLLGRAVELGDQRGARLLATRLCRMIIQMAFLQERRYRPYDKWLGTAFTELTAAATLGPLLDATMNHQTTTADSPLSRALVTLGHRHAALGISATVTPVIGDFPVNINNAVRPYPVLNAGDFVTTTTEAITDPTLRELITVGGIDQLTHADDVLINFTSWPRHLTQIYRALLRSPQSRPPDHTG